MFSEPVEVKYVQYKGLSTNFIVRDLKQHSVIGAENLNGAFCRCRQQPNAYCLSICTIDRLSYLSMKEK